MERNIDVGNLTVKLGLFRELEEGNFMAEYGLIALFERSINLDEGVIAIHYSRGFRTDGTI
jgi:hypothetical protein